MDSDREFTTIFFSKCCTKSYILERVPFHFLNVFGLQLDSVNLLQNNFYSFAPALFFLSFSLVLKYFILNQQTSISYIICKTREHTTDNIPLILKRLTQHNYQLIEAEWRIYTSVK